MDSRAYTRIDAGNAILGNRWLVRAWSTFTGNTVSILEKMAGLEWTARAGPGFRFDTSAGDD